LKSNLGVLEIFEVASVRGRGGERGERRVEGDERGEWRRRRRRRGGVRVGWGRVNPAYDALGVSR
jgi:hypothetical protein